ncbi:zinc-binding protein A33-like [Boleophthalmus pectinirostris]|uniref:zinc-binding protein A33-like n=1 Tax=Boleophthalmus pectinirostris TaxID=150288 RepID=UPI00242EEC40|nr:zinc-binding protein A33-like [Boleophthalmus pectinirostris]
MASSVFEDFLTCPICYETFSEPVSLGCNHSFCLKCIENFWQKSSNRNCPVCRRKSSKESISVNFALKELTNSFKQTPKEEEVECSKHDVRLFCLDDGRILCPICEFSGHLRHKVVELDKAVIELKDHVESQLNILKQEKEMVQKAERCFVELKRHLTKQVWQCEMQVRAQFSRFYQFLKKEEEQRVEELKEEQKRKDGVIKEKMVKIQEQLDKLNKRILNMEDQISTMDQNVQLEKGKVTGKDLEFLKEYSKSQSQIQAQEFKPVLPKIESGMLINQAKIVGNLGFNIWEKMRTIVHFSPVILDPNTMNQALRLSDDLTKVRLAEDQTEKLPNNPERFTNEEIVLGEEGFDGGVHSWEVEVGDYSRWDIGVVKASVDRRGEIFTDEESGIWCLWFGDGVYNDGDMEHVIEMKKKLERVRITLDFTKGFVSFYDADDLTHLLTHRYNFTEKLFPYISIGPSAGETTKEVQICTKTFT